MAGYNQESPSRLIAYGFTFFCQQHQSAGMSLTFRVSAYSRDRLIGEEIRYISDNYMNNCNYSKLQCLGVSIFISTWISYIFHIIILTTVTTVNFNVWEFSYPVSFQVFSLLFAKWKKMCNDHIVLLHYTVPWKRETTENSLGKGLSMIMKSWYRFFAITVCWFSRMRNVACQMQVSLSLLQDAIILGGLITSIA